MTFRRGQQVVCIEDNWGHDSYEGSAYIPNTYPVKKGVYTIWEINVNKIGTKNHKGYLIHTAMLVFEEIYFTNTDPSWRPSWRADWFRPVKTTSIETFEKIANTIPKPLKLIQPIKKTELV